MWAALWEIKGRKKPSLEGSSDCNHRGTTEGVLVEPKADKTWCKYKRFIMSIKYLRVNKFTPITLSLMRQLLIEIWIFHWFFNCCSSVTSSDKITFKRSFKISSNVLFRISNIQHLCRTCLKDTRPWLKTTLATKANYPEIGRWIFSDITFYQQPPVKQEKNDLSSNIFIC